jgi:hypothetical protein
VHPGVQDPEAQVSPDAWIMEIQTYLKDNILPDDSASVDRIAHLGKRYTLVEGDLYQHGINGIIMRCITQEEGCKLLIEVHGGKCGNHASSLTLLSKAIQHSFYSPTTLQDAVELVKICRACQFHTKQIHTSAQMLQMISPSWSLDVWGLDILGYSLGLSEGTISSTSPLTNSLNDRKRPLLSRSTTNWLSSSSILSYAGSGSQTGS